MIDVSDNSEIVDFFEDLISATQRDEVVWEINENGNFETDFRCKKVEVPKLLFDKFVSIQSDKDM